MTVRAVLDTNVIVSALISPFGNEAGVLLAVRRQQVVPCLSRVIVREYAGVLARKRFSFAPSEIKGLLDLFKQRGIFFDPPPVSGLSRDPGDVPFITCALAAHADFLITGNKRHFPRQSCGNTRVVSARELIEVLRTEPSR